MQEQPFGSGPPHATERAQEPNHPSLPQNAPQRGAVLGQSENCQAETHRVSAGHVVLQPTDTRRLYDAILVTPGRIRQDNGDDSNWLIPAEVLQDAADRGLFAAIPHYVDHPDQFGFGWHQRPSVRDLAGVATQAWYDPSLQAVRAQIRLYDQTEAGQLLAALYDQIIADREAGRETPPLGLSISCFREYEHDDDRGLNVWTRIHKVSSVDAVYEPGAAGYIRQALSTIRSAPVGSAARPLPHPTAPVGSAIRRPPQGEQPLNTQGETMPEETPTPDQVSQTDPHDPQEVIQEPVAVAEPNTPETVPEPRPPAFDAQRIQENLATLNAAVERLHGLVAGREEQNTVQGLGDPPRSPTLYGGYTGLQRIEQAVEAMLSGTRPPSGVRPLTGIRELYMLLSGDYELTGRFHDDRVYLANVTTSTMAGLVANALNKIVINMFQSYNQWWAPATTIRDFNSLQDVRWITLGGVGELPTVAEGAAYSELTWDDQTETDSFVKKGGYLGITLETIDKDDTGRVMAAPRALAQGAWLTLGKSIAEVFTSNSGVGPSMSDGNNLFDNSNHSNYGSTALSYAAWKATQILMMKYTEVNSSERLGALTRPRFLWVPIDLEDTALEILAAGEGEPDDADYHVNPDALADGLTARTAAARRRVITVPFWTNTGDWVAQADPNLYPGLGLAFRYGRTPEVFSVADPRAGLMFTNDTMPIKVRFFFAVGPTDWRAWYKHNV